MEEGAGAAVFKGVILLDAEGLKVGAKSFEGGWGGFGKPGVGGAAGDGFNAYGAGAGVEIDETAAGEAGGEDVEEGFAEAV